MKQKLLVMLALGVVVTVACLPGFAHHGSAAYGTNNMLTVKGTGEGWLKHLRRYLTRFPGCRNSKQSEQVLGCFLLAAEQMHD